MSVSTLGAGNEHGTFIVRDRDNLHKLIDAILDINAEEQMLGEYAIMITEELGARVDVVWCCDDDPIVFGRECDVYEDCTKEEEEDAED